MRIERHGIRHDLTTTVDVSHVASGPHGCVGATRVRQRHAAQGRVQDVAVESLEITETTDDGGFSASVQWTASGSVGHWGHIHKRSNRYQAELDIAPVDGVWKIVGLELLQEERI